MLIDRTLFGEINKVDIAIKRLQELEPPEGYYLAFSGGKDSVCLYFLCKMAKVKFEAHYNVTTIDPPDQVYFVRSFGHSIIWHYPKIPLLRHMLTRGFPLRQYRWCCEYLKENHGEGRIVLTGIRWQESFRRRQRKITEECYKGSGKIYFHPIIDWSDEDVWEFIKYNSLPYCNLYDKGYNRVGCLFCPMQSYYIKSMSAKLYPGYLKLFIYYFNKLFHKRVSEDNDSVSRWSSGTDMFYWWFKGEGHIIKSKQMSLFD